MTKQLPGVGRIQGATVEPSAPKDSIVRLQYTDDKQQLYELEIPFLDAMYLLNILRGIEKDMGFEAQNRPT